MEIFLKPIRLAPSVEGEIELEFEHYFGNGYKHDEFQVREHNLARQQPCQVIATDDDWVRSGSDLFYRDNIRQTPKEAKQVALENSEQFCSRCPHRSLGLCTPQPDGYQFTGEWFPVIKTNYKRELWLDRTFGEDRELK